MKPNLKRLAGTTAVLAAMAAAVSLYATPSARGSDHQDSNTMINRPSADITDVYLFPSPATPANVVLAMDTHPLIPAGTGSATYFDPAVMYQFKLVHTASAYTPGGSNNAPEDTVIQFKVNGSDSNQTLSLYGPVKPSQTGTVSNFTGTAASTPIPYGQSTSLNITGPDGQSYPIKVYAGPRSDPFFFDLAQFFKIVPDRNASYHASGATVPAASSASFRGFTAAFNTANGTTCDTSAAHEFLTSGGADAVAAPSGAFNVLSIVVEMPKTLLQEIPGNSTTVASQPIVHLWATTGTTSGT